MRRKDREISRDEALGVVDRCAYGVMAMTSPEGDAYCVPLSIVREGENIYFHAAQEGTKTDCLRHNPKVCISCVDGVVPLSDRFTTLYESAIVRGTAEEVLSGGEKINALRIICEKYTPANMPNFDEAIERSLSRTAVWKIHIDEITGKAKRA